MIAVLQRVTSASVVISHKEVAGIGPGILVLLGISQTDTQTTAKNLAEKIANLRIMADQNLKMNKSLLDTSGELLVVSQFTLLANTSYGRRPSFINAAEPKKAKKLYESFVLCAKMLGLKVQTGRFGKYMSVNLVNDGPVTIIINTEEK